MIHRLRPIEQGTPVSRFLAANDAAHFSMITRGKPVLNAQQYFASFGEVEAGEITYLYAPDLSQWEKVAERLGKSRASLLILNSELSLFVSPQMNQALLFCAHPKMLFADLVKRSLEQLSAEPILHFDPRCSIGRNTIIESGAILGDNIVIGDNCTIYGNVTLGNNVVVKPGAVLGGAGFEFYKDEHGQLCHFPHSGRVIIEDNVYIGANVVIDAAVFKATVIRRGTKIDNLVSIAHNVEVGEECLVMAQASLAGSVTVGSRTRIGLAAAIRDGVSIGADSVVGMSACVTADLPEGVTAYGVPAKPVNRPTPGQTQPSHSKQDTLARTARLIDKAVRRLELNLQGLTVLTEAATGHFAVTASIAALAGAKVLAVTGDSPYGTAADAADATLILARKLGIEDRMTVVGRFEIDLSVPDIVTNLGFVRPLDRSIIAQMKPGAVIPVMYDARELRPGEIDLDACRQRGVHVLGTSEEHRHANILSYCGPLSAKLLLEQDIELQGSRIAVLGDNFFTAPIVRSLERNGAELFVITHWNDLSSELLATLDAMLYIDYWNRLGVEGFPAVQEGLGLCKGGTLIQFVGGLDLAPFKTAGWRVAPATPVPPHRMWRTLAYLGPAPVIELHAAGLKAAELEFRQVPYDSGNQYDGLRQPIVAFRPAEVPVTQ